ncbi:MAG: DUF177 domain-containing protein [Sphingomonadales bacterium]|nr:DUF177 domain-containing protein [Sphingomonadales bacterium]
MTDTPELSRIVHVRAIDGRPMVVTATPAECAALAERFGLVAVDRLEATLDLVRDGDKVNVGGRLRAAFVQACAVSAEDVPVRVDEALSFRFVPAIAHKPNEEMEIDAEQLDELEYDDGRFDLGEAVAQSLALAIDPFLTGPDAEAARIAAGLGTPEDSGPFAALAALKLKK